MERIAVIAPENPPWTDVVHVFHQKIPFHGFTAVFDSCMAQHDKGNMSSDSSRTNDRRKVSNIMNYCSDFVCLFIYFIFDILNGCSANVSNISVTK